MGRFVSMAAASLLSMVMAVSVNAQGNGNGNGNGQAKGPKGIPANAPESVKEKFSDNFTAWCHAEADGSYTLLWLNDRQLADYQTLPDDRPPADYFIDADNDGYGVDVAYAGEPRCDAPAGYVDNVLDCDDTDAGVNPDPLTVEITGNGKDDDCNPATPDVASSACPCSAELQALPTTPAQWTLQPVFLYNGGTSTSYCYIASSTDPRGVSLELNPDYDSSTGLLSFREARCNISDIDNNRTIISITTAEEYDVCTTEFEAYAQSMVDSGLFDQFQGSSSLQCYDLSELNP